MEGRKLAIDAVALAIYLVAANPAVTGVGLHEWVGLGVFLVFVIHCALHVDWIIDVVRGLRSKPSLARWGNLVLDALIVVAFMVVSVSGLFMSGSVLQSLGLYADGYYFWNPLHAVSAKLLLALLLVHVVVHWRWIARFISREKHGNKADEPKEICDARDVR